MAGELKHQNLQAEIDEIGKLAETAESEVVTLHSGGKIARYEVEGDESGQKARHAKGKPERERRAHTG